MTEATKEDDDGVVVFIEKIARFTNRETEDCPYCGKHVSRVYKVGRCVYSSPCGCRLWQGTIPEKWRK